MSEKPEQVTERQSDKRVDTITIRLDRGQGGAMGIESNMAFISDQIGLLEMAKNFIIDRWKYAQASALVQEQAQRITPANVIPTRRN